MQTVAAHTLLLIILCSVAQAQVQLPDVSIKLFNISTAIRNGGKVILNCISIQATSGIIWKRDNVVISSNDRTNVTTFGNSRSRLTLNRFSGDLNGNYTCSASNSIGIVSSSTVFLEKAFVEVNFSHSMWENPLVVDVVKGQPAVINCDGISSNPEPEVIWKLALNSAIFLTLDYDSDRAIIDNNGSLILIEPRQSDNSLIYRCGARNRILDMSRDFGFIQLRVIEAEPVTPLHMLVRPRDVIAVRGSWITLECIPAGLGSTELSVTWSTNGLSRSFYRIRSGSRRITLYEISEAHRGVYTCEVESIGTFTATVTLLEPPVLVSTLSASNVTYGDSLSLSCSSSSPVVTWQWYFNGSSLVNEVSSSLEVAYVTMDHHGTYQCIAYNAAGATKSAAFLQVKVIAAHITEPLPDSLLAFIGRPITIKCSARGAPPPKFQWFKDGVLLQDGDQYSFTNEEELLIKEVDTAGSIICIVHNALSSGEVIRSDSVVTELRVLGPTIITVREELVNTAEVGHGAVLRCSASFAANGAITFHWTKDGSALENTSHTSLVPVDGGVWVFIERVEYEDQGEFNCIVTTRLDQFAAPNVSYTTQLVVSDVPVAPAILLLRSMAPNSFDIEWSFWGNIYGILYYDIEVQLASKPDSDWTSLKQQSVDNITRTSVTSPTLMAYTLFDVHVVALHRDGRRLQSPVSQVLMGIDVPEGPPRELTVLAPDSKSLQLSWMPPAVPRGPITNYVIRYHKKDESNSTRTIHSNNTNYMLTGLQVSERWEVRVAAETEAGMGPFTPKVSASFKDSHLIIGLILLTFVVVIILIIIVCIAICICKHKSNKVQARNYHVRHSGYFVKGLAVGGMEVTDTPLGPDSVTSYMNGHKRAFSSSSPTTPRTGCMADDSYKLEAGTSFGGMGYTSNTHLSVRGSGVSQQESPLYLQHFPSSTNPTFEESFIKSRSRSQSRTSASSRVTDGREEKDVLEKKHNFVMMQSPSGFSPASKTSSYGVFMSSGTFNKKNMEAGYDDSDSSMEKKALESISDVTELVDNISVYSNLAPAAGTATPTFNVDYHPRLCQPPLGVGRRAVNVRVNARGSSEDIRGGGTEEVARSMSIGELVHNRLQAQSPMEGLKDYSTFV